jgi:hypothetical protein
MIINKTYLNLGLLLVIFLSPFSLLGDDKKLDQNIFKELQRGERVTIILNSGLSYTGIIKSIINNKIEIDISYDEPILRGSFSFHDKEIKSIQSRFSIGEALKEKIIEEKERTLPQLTQPKHSPTTTTEQPNKGQNSSSTNQANTNGNNDESEKAILLDLLRQFPPGKTWNAKTYETLSAENEILRTDEEKRFLDQYDLWLQAIALKEKIDRLDFFKRYLPENGWGADKHEELITKFIRLKVGLTPEEQEFVDKYETWKRARVEYEEEKKNQEENKKENNTETNPSPSNPEENPPPTPPEQKQ